MAGKSVPIVLVPRFTSYLGVGFFYSIPVPVAAYDALVLDFWHGTITGTAPVAMYLYVEESTDGNVWTPTAGPTLIPSPYTPTPGEDQFRQLLTKAWLRLGVELTGTNVGVTCWASGYLELREK